MAAPDNEAVPTARYSPATLRGLMTSDAQDMNSAATTAEQCVSSASTAVTSQGFSRSTGLPAHMGKATEDCKTKLPFCVKADVLRAAHSLDMTESEWVRLVLMEKLYGADEVQRMHLAQIRAVVGMGPIGPLTGSAAS